MNTGAIVASIALFNFLLLIFDRIIVRGRKEADLVTHEQLDKRLEKHPTRDQMDLKYVGLEVEVCGLRKEVRGLREDLRYNQANRKLPPLPSEGD